MADETKDESEPLLVPGKCTFTVPCKVTVYPEAFAAAFLAREQVPHVSSGIEPVHCETYQRPVRLQGGDWKSYPALSKSIVFHVDTGSSKAVLVRRVVQDPDVAGVTEAEVEAEVGQLVQEGILAARPNPYDNQDLFLTVTEFKR